MPQTEPKKKILITDDDKSTTLLLSAIFKGSFQVETARDSREAILKIHEFQPDLITSDINMPGLEGDDLLPIIRAWKPHIAVLVISGSIDTDIQEKCIARGASGFIPKPFERTSLLGQVQQIFAGEIPVPIISEKILSEVELAIMILEREGLITREQSKEEFSKVKSRIKN
jgi:CheY-like chemotaxis protein